MANRRKKDKMLSFFKSKFNITLFYKPSYKDNDIFYVIILDDILQLRFKNVGNVIIVDEVKPLVDEHADFSKELITFFLNQASFNILISKLGNNPAINKICSALNIPVVDDERFITVPLPLYKRYIDYYKSNSELYGFYLLAVLDDITIEQETSEDNDAEEDTADNDINEDDEISIEPTTKTPAELKNYLMDELIEMSKSGKCSVNSSTEYDINVSLTSDIDMILSTGSNVIEISDIKFSASSSSTSLLMFVQDIISKFNDTITISIVTSANNKNVISLCDILDFVLDKSHRGGVRYIKQPE